MCSTYPPLFVVFEFDHLFYAEMDYMQCVLSHSSWGTLLLGLCFISSFRIHVCACNLCKRKFQLSVFLLAWCSFTDFKVALIIFSHSNFAPFSCCLILLLAETCGKNSWRKTCLSKSSKKRLREVCCASVICGVTCHANFVQFSFSHDPNLLDFTCTRQLLWLWCAILTHKMSHSSVVKTVAQNLP